jgi:hypothetical protein
MHGRNSVSKCWRVSVIDGCYFSAHDPSCCTLSQTLWPTPHPLTVPPSLPTCPRPPLTLFTSLRPASRELAPAQAAEGLLPCAEPTSAPPPLPLLPVALGRAGIDTGADALPGAGRPGGAPRVSPPAAAAAPDRPGGRGVACCCCAARWAPPCCCCCAAPDLQGIGLPWPPAAAPFCCMWLGSAEVDMEWCGGWWWCCWCAWRCAARIRIRSSSRITPEYLSSSSNCTAQHSTTQSELDTERTTSPGKSPVDASVGPAAWS